MRPFLTVFTTLAFLIVTPWILTASGEKSMTGEFVAFKGQILTIKYLEPDTGEEHAVEFHLNKETKFFDFNHTSELRVGDLVSVDYSDDSYRFWATRIDRQVMRQAVAARHILSYLES